MSRIRVKRVRGHAFQKGREGFWFTLDPISQDTTPFYSKDGISSFNFCC